MKSYLVTVMLLGVAVLAWAPDASAQEQETERTRLAQTGMKFLSVSVHARAAAMADAMTAQEASSIAMFYNPASMAEMSKDFDVALGKTEWLAGTSYNAASAAYRPLSGRYGTFGLAVVAVDYGEHFLETIRADNEQGFIDLGQYSPSAISVGLGYARALTDRFAVGANLKYVTQSLGEATMSVDTDGNRETSDFSVNTMAVDFGVLFRTGIRSLNFALSARNFSRELTYAEENFELPLTFSMGISADLFNLSGYSSTSHALNMAVEASRPRDFAEQVKVGMEYTFINLLSLRAGYLFPSDEQGINLGAGLSTDVSGISLGIDYAYSQFGIFGDVNRVALQFGF